MFSDPGDGVAFDGADLGLDLSAFDAPLAAQFQVGDDDFVIAASCYCGSARHQGLRAACTHR